MLIAVSFGKYSGVEFNLQLSSKSTPGSNCQIISDSEAIHCLSLSYLEYLIPKDNKDSSLISICHHHRGISESLQITMSLVGELKRVLFTRALKMRIKWWCRGRQKALMLVRCLWSARRVVVSWSDIFPWRAITSGWYGEIVIERVGPVEHNVTLKK